MTRSTCQGFTLLELLIALALFALLGLASWGLLDSAVRSEQGSARHVQEMRMLQRALAVVERDLLHARTVGGRAAIVLEADLLNVQRGHWLNPLDQPRSDWQEVSYDLGEGVLWRHSRGEHQVSEPQRLLGEATAVRWRILDQHGVWQRRWPIPRGQPQAVELTLTSGKLADIRRVFLLPGASP